MYAKFENGRFIVAPNKLSGDGVTVFNPPAEMYRMAGYKPVQFTTSPDAPEGYTYESSWEEQEDQIVQTWALVPEPEDIDDAEAFDIIFGGAQ